MKGTDKMKKRLLTVILALAGVITARADELTIESFHPTGELAFRELSTATLYQVQWTTNLYEPTWTNSVPGISHIVPLAGDSLTVTVGVVHASCYYRILASVTNAPPPVKTSTFDLDSEDWRVVSYPFRSHVASPATSVLSHDGAFGNPAGSVRLGDVYAETGISAPAKYLGSMTPP